MRVHPGTPLEELSRVGEMAFNREGEPGQPSEQSQTARRVDLASRANDASATFCWSWRHRHVGDGTLARDLDHAHRLKSSRPQDRCAQWTGCSSSSPP
jgi:hypothetical protein